MTDRLAALGAVGLCVLALGVTAAGLPALSPEPPAESSVPESENVSVGDVNHSGDGADDPTPSGSSNGSSELDIISRAGAMVDRGIGGLPGNYSAGATGQTSGGPPSLLGVPVTLVGVVGLALVGAVLALRSVSGSVDESGDDADPTDEASEPSEETDTDVGAVAGRAADAIADTDDDAVENAVYRAWYEMTAALDVANPTAATPGEFAAAARAAGLDAEAVADLTTVFEAVRYGDRPVSDYEDRAVSALRRIAAEDDADASAAIDASVVDESPDSSDGGDGE